MPVSPNFGERFATRVAIRRVYQEAETEMLRKVARRLERGIDAEGWAERKLQEISQLRRETEAEIRRLSRANPDIREAIEDAYTGGSGRAVRDMREAGRVGIATELTATNQQRVEAMTRATLGLLEQSQLRILRVTQDAYRGVIAQASEQVAAGVMTRREAAQVALNRFADAGISGFVDRAGRAWDLPSYAEMAVRSTTGQAAVQGHIDRLQENDEDTVIVSVSPEPCPLCDPWEGRTLSISGADPDRPSVDEATAEGLFHPNCTHSLGLWVPGLSREAEDAKLDDRRERYEDRQEQRYNERQIRKWKNREATAITEEEQRKASAKVNEWQARQREHIEATGRRRRSEREQITRAR